MGKFRDAMSRELALRGFAPTTCKCYLGCMHRLVKRFKRAPDQLREDEVVEYFRDLASSGVSSSSFNQSLSAARILFGSVLKRRWSLAAVDYQRAPRRVPVVFSPEEVQRLLEASDSCRDRALFEAGYGAGLRVSEVVRLRPSDIDSQRMTIRIHRGKGAKDRYVPLPRQLLTTLRLYSRGATQRQFLFSGRNPDKPVDKTIVGRVFQRALLRAGIDKPATFHTLRHSFATHQIESGVSLRVLQVLLGHRSISSTERYLHVAGDYLKKTTSPLDLISHSSKHSK